MPSSVQPQVSSYLRSHSFNPSLLLKFSPYSYNHLSFTSPPIECIIILSNNILLYHNKLNNHIIGNGLYSIMYNNIVNELLSKIH